MDYSTMKATRAKRETTDINVPISRKSTNKTKRGLKKLRISYILVALFLIIGVAAGFFVSKYAFKGDTFEMNSVNENIDITIGGDNGQTSYDELGAKCVAFGKDISNEITTTYFYRSDLSVDPAQVDFVDTSKEGIYYAVYTTSNIKYKSVKLIRNIIVLRSEDNG